jgi:hypothetical protein
VNESLRSVLREHLLEKDDEELTGYDVEFPESFTSIPKFKLDSSGKGSFKVKAELMPMSRYGFMSGEPIKPVSGTVDLKVEPRDWKDLKDDLGDVPLKDVMASVFACGPMGDPIKPSDRSVRVRGEVEVYVKDKGKDVTADVLGSPPSVLFTGTFKF